MPGILDLCGDLARVRFDPGDTLILEGEPAPGLFILISGTVSVRKGGNEVARIGRAEAVFGETSALLGSPATASVIARTEVEARYVADGLGYITSNPDFAVHTARLLAARLARATNGLFELKALINDRSDHFGTVDEVLEALLSHRHVEQVGSERGRTSGRNGPDGDARGPAPNHG